MGNTFKLAEVASHEIAALTSAGINLTPAQIVAINDLCWESASRSASEVSYTGTPVRLPNSDDRYLWAYTIAGAEWYQWACDALPENSRLFALVYALEHGREEGAFDRMWSAADAEKVLRKYKRGLRCTLGELLSAVGDVMPEQHVFLDEQDGDKGNPEALLAQLVGMTGIPADVWKHRASFRYCIAQIDACRKLADAGGPDTTTAKIEAERRIGAYIQSIIASRSDNDGE